MKRINKRVARKLYDSGKPFIMVPCNLRPDSFAATVVNSAQYQEEIEFDRMVNAFCYYNCGTAEVGNYPSYYTVE